MMTSQMSLSQPLGPTCRQEVTTSTDPVTITLRTKRTCTQSLTRRSPVFCHSVLCIVAVCVTVCVLSTLCCCCARVGLRVQASVNSLFYTFLHAELLWLPSHCQCVKTANERERERKKRWQNINCLLLPATHTSPFSSLFTFLTIFVCLWLFFYTCI